MDAIDIFIFKIVGALLVVGLIIFIVRGIREMLYQDYLEREGINPGFPLTDRRASGWGIYDEDEDMPLESEEWLSGAFNPETGALLIYDAVDIGESPFDESSDNH